MLCKEYVGNVDLLGCVNGLSHGCCKYGQMTWDEWNLINDNSSGIYRYIEYIYIYIYSMYIHVYIYILNIYIYIYIHTLNSTSVLWRIYS